MGMIVPRRAMRENERRKIETRLKLFDAHGIPADEANTRALAKVRGTKF
jgi:hypothetical protein